MTMQSSAGSRVLVVDDEPMVREVVQTYLERDGFDVTAVESGREALEFMKSNDADLVILDVMLPEIDGFTVLRRLRDHTNVPVILLTARPDANAEQEHGSRDHPTDARHDVGRRDQSASQGAGTREGTVQSIDEIELSDVGEQRHGSNGRRIDSQCSRV
jgi:CheY-like chemotaxis protein